MIRKKVSVQENQQTKNLIATIADILNRDPNYIPVKQFYHQVCDQTVLLHAAMVICDKLQPILKAHPKTRTIALIALTYLCTTPAATPHEIRKYLEIFFGNDFGRGNKERLNLIGLKKRGWVEEVTFKEFARGRRMYRITPEGKEIIKPLTDASIIRSIRDYIVYRQNVHSSTLLAKKRRVINAKYPELKKWKKL